MIGDAHFTHFVLEKGEIENSKNMEFLEMCQIKVSFDKRSVHLKHIKQTWNISKIENEISNICTFPKNCYLHNIKFQL